MAKAIKMKQYIEVEYPQGALGWALKPTKVIVGKHDIKNKRISKHAAQFKFVEAPDLEKAQQKLRRDKDIPTYYLASEKFVWNMQEGILDEEARLQVDTGSATRWLKESRIKRMKEYQKNGFDACIKTEHTLRLVHESDHIIQWDTREPIDRFKPREIFKPEGQS